MKALVVALGLAAVSALTAALAVTTVATETPETRGVGAVPATTPCAVLAAPRPDPFANAQALSVDPSLPDDDSPTPVAARDDVEPAWNPGPQGVGVSPLPAHADSDFEGSRRMILLC